MLLEHRVVEVSEVGARESWHEGRAQRRTRPCSYSAWRVEACDARGGLLRWPDLSGGCAKSVNGGSLIPRQMS
jgi:hypothetical protein